MTRCTGSGFPFAAPLPAAGSLFLGFRWARVKEQTLLCVHSACCVQLTTGWGLSFGSPKVLAIRPDS
jgi:hypothetical protein